MKYAICLFNISNAKQHKCPSTRFIIPIFLIGFCMQNNLIWGFCEFSVTNPNCLQPR